MVLLRTYFIVILLFIACFSVLLRYFIRKEGFDTSFWSDLTSTGCKCGKYRLFKTTREEFYNLEKI